MLVYADVCADAMRETCDKRMQRSAASLRCFLAVATAVLVLLC
jgi:hypothetical protein